MHLNRIAVASLIWLMAVAAPVPSYGRPYYFDKVADTSGPARARNRADDPRANFDTHAM